MNKPEPHPEEKPKADVAQHQGASFEDLLLLVSSGPMCFECLNEMEEKEWGGETESDKQV